VGGQCVPNLPSNPILYIPIQSVSFTPAKANPARFSEQALTIKVVDSLGRISNTATCTIEFRPFRNSSVANESLYTSNGLTSVDGTYDSTNGCSAVLPANAQTTARYEFRIRITDPEGVPGATPLVYGIDTAYSLNFGAIGVVTIGVAN
jgi:hypothetical protein